MKCRAFQCRTNAVDALVRAVEDSGASWVRFGEELFVYAAKSKWDEVTESLSSRATPLDKEVHQARKRNMHLVVQKGRTFQNEYPTVPVLLDKGRYLVVDMDRKTATEIGRRKEPCFRIERLAANHVVFDVRRPPETRIHSDPRVSTVIASLDPIAVQTDLAHLASHPTRLSTSNFYQDAANWAAGRLTSLGYSTAVETVPVGTAGASLNVIATKAGVNGLPRRRVIVTGHLDSVNQLGGPAAAAPGADDNATGATGVLEIARIMSGLQFVHDLVFILFGGEEQGLYGSQHYVAELSPTDKDAILAVINMDMIGTLNTTLPTVLLEGAPVSQAMIDRLAAAAMAYTTLTVQTSLSPFGSDHIPFIDAGMPAVLTIEGADEGNEAIHTANDTLDRVDVGLALEIMKMNAAAVAELASVRQDAHPCPGCGPPKGGSVHREEGEVLRVLSTQYQHLFAQYSRLHRLGRLHAQDYEAWQVARRMHDSVARPAPSEGRS